MRICPSLVSLLLFVSCSSSAQQPPPLQLDPDYVITNWRAEEGLPESSATDMVQTPDGYLWFGTFGGLVRFDGMRFTVFRPSNLPALPHSGVVTLHLDRQKRMWVSTLGGTARYRDGIWEKVTLPEGWQGHITGFKETADGRLCISSSSIDIACEQNGTFQARHRFSLQALGSQHLRMLLDEAGELYAGLDNGFLRLRAGKWEPVPLPPGLPKTVGGPGSDWNDAGSGHWLLLQGKTLFEVTKDQVLRKRQLGRAYENVYGFVKENDGTIWMVSYSDGLIRVRPDGTERQFAKSTGMKSSSYRFLFIDRDGNYWAGSDGTGLFRLTKRAATSFGAENGLPDFPVKSVAVDGSGSVLAGTYGGGVQRLRGGKFQRIEGGGPDFVHAVLVDRSQRLWIASYQKGLWLGTGRTLVRVPGDNSGGSYVEALFEDSKGRIWIGASDQAAVFENGEFRPIQVVEGKEPTFLSCFAEDTRTGTIWAGGEGGLYEYRDGRFLPVKDRAGQKLPSIRAISVAENGGLWLGTAEAGLYRWQDAELAKAPLPDGISGAIGAILRHGDDFWMSTTQGIWRIDNTDLEAAADHGGRNGAWRHFGREDGMVSFEVSVEHQPSATQGPDGKLLFPTLKGVAVVDPVRNPNARVAEVLFQSVSFRNEAGVEESIDAGRERVVTIPASGQDAQASFTSVSGGSSANLFFDYEFWHGGELLGSGRLRQPQLRLHRLAPGENLLRVRATNAEGAWSPVWTDLVIYREPFLWERWQTQFAAVLFGALAVAWVFRNVWRKRVLEHEEKVNRMRELQESLLRAKEAALESARVKGEFLANMSHEIRTPLNGILGAGKLLEMSERNREERELIATMMESGEMLRRLLSDILELSQIEAGRMVLQPTVFNFRKLIAETVRLVEPEARGKGIRLGYDVAAEIPEFVRSDATRIQQIALNYLNNAVKFTDVGAVDLNVIVSRREETRLLLQIRVSDTGSGIVAGKREVIFEAFEQADTSSTRRKGGIGLGLSIVKRIAELMGGSVGLESYEGVGSTFWATFRAEEAVQPKAITITRDASTPFTSQLAGLRILLAEDNRVNRMIATRMLNQLGCRHVDVAETGKQVLEKSEDATYDLILMDVHMPEIDGIEATRALRSGNSSNKGIPIVALTASVLDIDRERCLEAGMNDFIPKPVELRELQRVVESIAVTRTE